MQCRLKGVDAKAQTMDLEISCSLKNYNDSTHVKVTEIELPSVKGDAGRHTCDLNLKDGQFSGELTVPVSLYPIELEQ